MGIYAFRLPDVGEGVAEAELVEWNVKPGDMVQEDEVIAAVMTDKAAVEVPSSVSGRVVSLGGEIGDLLAVGAVLIRIEVVGEGNETETETETETEVEANAETGTEAGSVASQAVLGDEVRQESTEVPEPMMAPAVSDSSAISASPRKTVARAKGTKPLAAPSVRTRAKEEGVDLRHVPGTGPAGRISHDDLSAFIESDGIQQGGVTRGRNTGVEAIKVMGMRRKIAEKMSIAKSRIPHITIVEEVNMSTLEELRKALNDKYLDQRPKLTILPFLMRAITEAVREQPDLNAHYDDEAGVLQRFGGVHIGVATQTPAGLSVPVVKHAEANSLWDNAAEISRLATSAREGAISRDELIGSTITISSLGPLGAIVTTPIINHPEVAIVGVNKMQVRPVWDGQEFRPRQMMNLSCSFDHRVIDGWDAAVFMQKLKSLLESPAMLFVEG